MSRMGARWGRNLTGVCPSAALDSLPPSEPRAPFPATAVGATSVAVAFPSLLLPQTAADRASRPPGRESLARGLLARGVARVIGTLTHAPS